MEGAIWKIALWSLGILFVVVVLVGMFSGTGLFQKAKDQTSSIIQYLPELRTGAQEKEKSSGIVIPIEHQAAIDGFLKAIEELKKVDNKNCFVKFEGFPKLGTEGTSLIFERIPGTEDSILTIKGGKGGLQEAASYDLKGIRPCVMEGNFYEGEEIDFTLYAQPENSITIAQDVSIFNTRMNYGGGFKSFQLNWLYSPDGKQICVIPNVELSLDAFDENGDFLPNKAKQVCYFRAK